MKRPDLKTNLPIILLVLLFLAGFLEIFAYFFYIYKPASQIYGKGGGYRLEIPAYSQILQPGQITDPSVSLADTDKVLYPENITSFQTLLQKKILAGSTFVKAAAIEYILAGTVTSLDKTSQGNVVAGLKNSTGLQITEVFTVEELRTIPVTLITISQTNPSRNDSIITEARAGDYLIIKKSANLLKKGSDVATEVEIFRTSN